MLTNGPVRLLMWDMPNHAEHHLYPSIPFHRPAEAHQHIKDRLGYLRNGYTRWNVNWNNRAAGQARLRRATPNPANPALSRSNEAGSGTAETVETL